MNTLIHCIIFNISPQTQGIAWLKLEFGYEEGKMATKIEKLGSRHKGSMAWLGSPLRGSWLGLDHSSEARWLGLDLDLETWWFGLDLLEVEGVFRSHYEGLIRLAKKKIWDIVITKDWLDVVTNNVETEGMRWLVKALGLWYHKEN